MISRIVLTNFKSFLRTELALGPFTVIVGPNASGKSNIRDAFRFLHGVGRGYTLADIIGGRYGAGGQSEWIQMRGSGNEIVRFGAKSFKLGASFHLRKRRFHYTIEVEKLDNPRQAYNVKSEALYLGGEYLFSSHPGGDDRVNSQEDENHLLLRMAKTGGQKKYGNRITTRPDQPALTQISDSKLVSRGQKEFIDLIIQDLASIKFLDLVPDAMRQPAFPGQVVLGDTGDNLPTVLQEICSQTDRKDVLTQWVRELAPMDVVDFAFPINPITGQVQLQLIEGNGNTVSAYSASDSTLRFLAMLAALLGANPAKLYFFEEIDNGIHPSRLRLLLDLIETQTGKGNLQVVTTTHSPDLLSMIGKNTFESTSIVYRPMFSDASTVTRITTLPDAIAMWEKQRLGELHGTGWFEDAINFSEVDE